MDNDLALLHRKIDDLTQQVALQHQLLENLELNGNGANKLQKKLDFLVEQAEAQRRQREEFEELKGDMMPIINNMIKLSIDELAEIGKEFQVEDLFFLLKRLLRDTQLLVKLLDRLESTVELVDETQRIGKQVFQQAVLTLDRLEQEGYFAFARSSWRIVELIVQKYSQEDLQALMDSTESLLSLFKQITQPELISLASHAVEALQQPVQETNISMGRMLRELTNPKVQRGLYRLLQLLKALGEEPISHEQKLV